MPASAVDFHEEGAAEYDAAFDWYLQRSPEAALRFSAEVDQALVQITRTPRRWAQGAFQTASFWLNSFLTC